MSGRQALVVDCRSKLEGRGGGTRIRGDIRDPSGAIRRWTGEGVDGARYFAGAGSGSLLFHMSRYSDQRPFTFFQITVYLPVSTVFPLLSLMT
jgi:hypothetical protein